MTDRKRWIRKIKAHPLWKKWKDWRHPCMVCVLLDGTLQAAEMQEGKFLSAASAEMDEMTAEGAARAFRTLEEKGLRRKDILLLVNFPDLRITGRKYPAMTEEEMEETMYWEEDRIFRTEEPLSLGYLVTGHTPEGWEVHVEAVKKETLALWEKGALLAGKQIVQALPVTAVPLEEKPHFILYGRHGSAILLFRKGPLFRSRILKKEDGREKAALFMKNCLAHLPAEKADCFFIPMADCEAAASAFWKEALRKAAEDIKEEEDCLQEAVTLVESPFSGMPGPWHDMAPLLRRLPEGRLFLPLTEKNPSFLTKENQKLRAAQGICLLGLCFFLLAGGEYLSAGSRLADLRQEEAGLKPEKERMLLARADRERERELKELLKELEKKDGQWEKKLILLGEAVPAGVVLSSIKQNGTALDIRGTALSPEHLSLFRNSISSSWSAPVQNGKRQADPITGLVDFTISLKGDSHGGLEKKTQ